MRFPFSKLALEARLANLQIALLRSGGEHRLIPSPEEQTVQDFGLALFDALIGGEVRGRYDVSCAQAALEGKSLRLRLRIEPPELAALPWEFMYDTRSGDYVCLSKSLSLVRYPMAPQPLQPLAVDPPLRILGMVAGPGDLPRLNVDREMQLVEQAVASLRGQGLAELTWLEGQTWRDLQKAMRRGPWHIFHFIGHGGFDRKTEEGLIALVNEDGNQHLLGATELARLLTDHPSLRLVLLNACEGARGSDRGIFSSTAATLIQRGVPAVLAMQYPITDWAAIEFARTFYETLADQWPVDAAVAQARVAVSIALKDSLEWGTPVLYMRSPDGALFKFNKPAVDVSAISTRVVSAPAASVPATDAPTLEPPLQDGRDSVRRSPRVSPRDRLRSWWKEKSSKPRLAIAAGALTVLAVVLVMWRLSAGTPIGSNNAATATPPEQNLLLAQPTRTPSPTRLPSHTPTSSATPTLTATATDIQTPTPTLTSTSTHTPTATLTLTRRVVTRAPTLTPTATAATPSSTPAPPEPHPQEPTFEPPPPQP
jgi:hypothetical protein